MQGALVEQDEALRAGLGPLHHLTQRHGAADVHLALVEIHRLPTQGQRLGNAQAGEEQELEQGRVDAARPVLHLIQPLNDPVRLVQGERVDLLPRAPR
ncbi:hypothetical protein D9M68_784540 [compost metagenome]